jgi:hypothetical protein
LGRGKVKSIVEEDRCRRIDDFRETGERTNIWHEASIFYAPRNIRKPALNPFVVVGKHQHDFVAKPDVLISGRLPFGVGGSF